MSSFPSPKTHFVGRAGELARLSELVATGASGASGAPLITLWGPPGIGKTRLAIEACRARSEKAWFCDLVPARDADDIRRVVARELGVPKIEDALARLGRGVIVLDNFEHLAAHAAETVAAWSALNPKLTFVVTSRERLRLEGEIALEVTPLEEAVELFIDRARAAVSTFDAGVEPELIAEVVARLEGIPLAVELAAARVDVIGVNGLVTRLRDHQLELLGHGTLRHAIDTSFAMLGAAEQSVFAQCAVFEGSFDLEAAEAIVDTPAGSLLDVLQSLRNRSLLRCLHENGAVRFSFFESIREYALERLAARDDAPELRRRHARYYLAHHADLANLAAASGQALDDDRVGDVIEALARIAPSRMSDRLLDLLGRALDRAPSASGHRARGRALHLRGRLADACAGLETALSLANDDVSLAADIRIDLGVIHHQLRALDLAERYYEEALAVHAPRGNDVACGRCLGNLGAIHHDRRALEAAQSLYDRALAAFRRAREGAMEGIFLTNVAIVLHEQGAHDRASSTYQEAIARLVEVGDRRLEAIARTNLGILCHEMGRLEEAHACHAAAVAALHVVIDRCAEGLCLGRLGMVAAALGRREEALASCERGKRLLADIDDPMAHGVFALFRAFIELVLEGKVEAARGQVEASVALRELSDDARAAARLIEAATPGAVLVVGPAARWFAPPGGDVHDLGERHLLQRLLWCLVERHRAAPGDGLTLDALREAGWPGERALPEAAANRVHVALTELRRRGLRSCLVRKEAKYLIRPSLRIELSAS